MSGGALGDELDVWRDAPGVPKSVWGPKRWYWLHVLAICYPADPSVADARRAWRRIAGFAARLPCAVCREHAAEYLRDYPPALSDTYALQSWAWAFHNAVNRRLGKRALAYAEYAALFAGEIELAAALMR